MNPARRYDWPDAFAQLRAWIDSIVPPSKPQARCAECGGVIYLIHGRHSRKWFYSHAGLSGCGVVRAIMFESGDEAEQSEVAFE